MNELYNIISTILDPNLNNNKWIKILKTNKLKNIQLKIKKIKENEINKPSDEQLENQYLKKYSDIDFIEDRLKNIINLSKEISLKIKAYIVHNANQTYNNQFNIEYTHRDTFQYFIDTTYFTETSPIITMLSKSNLLPKLKPIHSQLSSLDDPRFMFIRHNNNLEIIYSIIKDIANRNISEGYKNLHNEFYNTLTNNEQLLYNQYILMCLLCVKTHDFFEKIKIMEDKFKDKENALLTELHESGQNLIGEDLIKATKNKISYEKQFNLYINGYIMLLINLIPLIIDIRILQFTLQYKIFNDKFIDNISIFIDNNVEQENAKGELIDDSIIPEFVPFLEIEEDIKTLGKLTIGHKYIKEDNQTNRWYGELNDASINENSNESLDNIIKYTTESHAEQLLSKINNSSSSNKYDHKISLKNISEFANELKSNHMYF